MIFETIVSILFKAFKGIDPSHLTPQVTSTGTTTVSLPLAPGTGGATTTGAAPTQNTNLFLPVGRSGISNGEQVNVGNQIYIWNQGNQTWVLSPSSGGSGTAKGRV